MKSSAAEGNYIMYDYDARTCRVVEDRRYRRFKGASDQAAELATETRGSAADIIADCWTDHRARHSPVRDMDLRGRPEE